MRPAMVDRIRGVWTGFGQVFWGDPVHRKTHNHAVCIGRGQDDRFFVETSVLEAKHHTQHALHHHHAHHRTRMGSKHSAKNLSMLSTIDPTRTTTPFLSGQDSCPKAVHAAQNPVHPPTPARGRHRPPSFPR